MVDTTEDTNVHKGVDIIQASVDPSLFGSKPFTNADDICRYTTATTPATVLICSSYSMGDRITYTEAKGSDATKKYRYN